MLNPPSNFLPGPGRHPGLVRYPCRAIAAAAFLYVIATCPTLIHLISIPVANTSVHPARSSGVAPRHAPALAQLWMFRGVPIPEAVIAGLVSPWLQGADGV